ncbi:MAG: carbohydrate ABC transporter permease [Sphaerochaeta sp.]|nr:carbohydrate ABC transporter permease [Sphaerochaeta sp.]
MRNSSLTMTERNERAVRRKRIISVVQWLLAIAVTVIAFFPIYWMLITSVKSQDEVLLLKPTFWPKEFHFENYANVLRKVKFAKYYMNTIIMTAGILVCQIVTGVFAAYGFSKGNFRGKNTLFLVVLGALMIPLQVTFIPIYVMFAHWGLTDTYLGLILPEAVSPYYIFMLRQTFLSIDDSYIDAAKIDGLGRWGSSPRFWCRCAARRCSPSRWSPSLPVGTAISGRKSSPKRNPIVCLRSDWPSCGRRLPARGR